MIFHSNENVENNDKSCDNFTFLIKQLKVKMFSNYFYGYNELLYILLPSSDPDKFSMNLKITSTSLI